MYKRLLQFNSAIQVIMLHTQINSYVLYVPINANVNNLSTLSFNNVHCQTNIINK